MNIEKIANFGYKAAETFVKSQENLSSTRFIQDTATNWLPKAVFTRSKEDFAEMSFLEFIESAIFYFASPILGEKLFRNGIFKTLQPKNIKGTVNKQIANSVENIVKNSNLSQNIKNHAIATKAGILLACIAIPVAEYTLSFAKNLFTLKTFKKSNFNNIANLDKKSNKKIENEDKSQQERVEKSAKSHLKAAAIISGAGLLAGIGLAKYGGNNEKLIKLSKNIIEPGKALAAKLNPKHEKIKNVLSSINFDFANKDGKLALSKGQLGLTALVGLFGYSRAAHDRGILDVLEVWTRVPLVVFYTIVGSELFEKGFINLLSKKNKCTDLIQKDYAGKLFVPKLKDLPELAKKTAVKNGIDYKTQYNKLLSQKTFSTAVPYAFSLLCMGFTLSAITRFWTQYRYNHSHKNQKKDTVLNFERNLPKAFKTFKK